VQEMFDFTYRSFSLSDKYRNPVMILADGMLGQMMEPLEFDEEIKPEGVVDKPWAMTGAKGRQAQCIRSLYLGDGVLEKHNEKLQKKFRQIEQTEKRSETYNCNDADILLIAYGSVSRIARASVDTLREKGLKAGLIRPITLWPFSDEEIMRFTSQCSDFFVIEMSSGQMVDDVKIAVQDNKKVHFYGRTGGGVPTEEEIVEKVKTTVHGV